MQLWQITRKLHTSWLIAYVSIGIVIGTALVVYVEQSLFSSIGWLLCSVCLIVVTFWRRAILIIPVAVSAGLLFGLWRGSVAHGQLLLYEMHIGKTMQITARISDDPDITEKGDMTLRLSNIVIDDHGVGGKIWASVQADKDLRRSDIVYIQGKLSQGFGNFSAAMYRATINEVQRPIPGDVAISIRDWFGGHVNESIQEPESSLGMGFLLGQRRSLPPELDQALVIAGLTHVVVASGYNLTILVRFARRLFVKISKYLATLSAAFMIASFIAITGSSPSMSRAGLVAGLSLAAWYYGRKFHPLVLLPFAAAITVIVDPSFAWNDLGWQLSFAAFAGVMILAPLIQRYFFGGSKPGIIRQILGETMSASIMTLPILVVAFGQFSNVALIANLLVLPLVPLAMALTFIAGIGSIVAPAFAAVLGIPAELLLSYMTFVIDYFAKLPWALSIVEVGVWVMWVGYAAIVAACIYLWKTTHYDLRNSNIIE